MQANFENHYSRLAILALDQKLESSGILGQKILLLMLQPGQLSPPFLIQSRVIFKTLQVVLLWHKDGKPLIDIHAF